VNRPALSTLTNDLVAAANRTSIVVNETADAVAEHVQDLRSEEFAHATAHATLRAIERLVSLVTSWSAQADVMDQADVLPGDSGPDVRRRAFAQAASELHAAIVEIVTDAQAAVAERLQTSSDGEQ
jgi:hypothetical protein